MADRRVGVRVVTSNSPGQHVDLILMRDVNNGQCILVVVEADLMSRIAGIRAGVDHALGVVGVSILRVAACEFRVGGVADVHHVQATGARLGAHGVQEAGRLVDDDVVGRACRGDMRAPHQTGEGDRVSA